MYIYVCFSFCRFLDDSRPEFCLNIFPVTKKKKKSLPASYFLQKFLFVPEWYIPKKEGQKVSIIKPKSEDQKYDVKASDRVNFRKDY